MRMVYRYPQTGFPYEELLQAKSRALTVTIASSNFGIRMRSRDGFFEIEIEYAKAGPRDILIRVTRDESQRSDQSRSTFCRRCGSAIRGAGDVTSDGQVCALDEVQLPAVAVIEANHHLLGDYRLYCEAAANLLFTENESNARWLWGAPNGSEFVKDAFHEFVVHGQTRCCESRTNRHESGRALPLQHTCRRNANDPTPPAAFRQRQGFGVAFRRF